MSAFTFEPHRTTGAPDQYIRFHCPGCGNVHRLPIGPLHTGAKWEWDGNRDAPTLSPSINATGGHHVPWHKANDDCWCTYRRQHPHERDVPECYRCHSFLKAGRVEFLADCTHALAGQAVGVPETQ